jgi:hypothetical protein
MQAGSRRGLGLSRGEWGGDGRQECGHPRVDGVMEGRGVYWLLLLWCHGLRAHCGVSVLGVMPQRQRARYAMPPPGVDDQSETIAAAQLLSGWQNALLHDVIAPS